MILVKLIGRLRVGEREKEREKERERDAFIHT